MVSLAKSTIIDRYISVKMFENEKYHSKCHFFLQTLSTIKYNSLNINIMKTVIKLFLCLFWLISIPTIAQNNPTTTKKDGLTVVTFKTKEGTVTVNLPNNIHAGDVISGTVITKPSKRSNKRKSEKEKNKEKDRLERLKKSNLEICGTSTPIAEGKFSFIVPKHVLSGVVEVELSDDEMDPIAMSSIIAHNIPRALTRIPLQIPNYLRSGYPQQIVGVFDGDFSTSSIQLNDSPLEILAESPGAIIVAIPENIVGIQELEITENMFNYATEINIVDLNLSADRMSLSRGDLTTIHLEVVGLERLEQHVLIHVDNLTPNAISLRQGNHQILIIEPEMVNEDGIFTSDYQISAQQTGGFSISAQLQESELQNADIPAPDEMNPSDPNTDDKPDNEQVSKVEQPIPAPDALNPSGPNSDEKPESEQEIKKREIESLEKATPFFIDKKQDENQANKKICGKIETEWKKIKGTGVLQEGSSENVTFKRSKCKKCGKYVDWKQYTTKFTIRVMVKRFAGLCPLEKDHNGNHKGLKPEFDYQDRTVYKDRKVKIGCSECGDLIKVGSKWKNLKKWMENKEKEYKKREK